MLYKNGDFNLLAVIIDLTCRYSVLDKKRIKTCRYGTKRQQQALTRVSVRRSSRKIKWSLGRWSELCVALQQVTDAFMISHTLTGREDNMTEELVGGCVVLSLS